MGELLEELAPVEEQLDPESDERALIRLVRRDWEKARRVPAELEAEMTRAASLAMPVWVKARQESDYSQFLPALRQNFELRRRYVECFDDYDEPYDVLLDDFEPGMKTAEVRAVFERLKQEQVPFVAEVKQEGERPLRGRTYPIDAQKVFELKVIERFGFDPAEWRLDTAVHPFASSIATTDIRLTTRYFEDNLDGLFGTMHETGHGLYEHGVDRRLERTPLAHGASLGFHESQSRLWENMVGRSLPFWRHFFPTLQQHFPDALGGATLEDWYRTVNWVEPSLIRVEADRPRTTSTSSSASSSSRSCSPTRSTSRSCLRSGTRACASTSASSRRTTRSASSRTCTGPSARSATSPPTRSATSSRDSCGSG
jgi:carboxypeptidase Taq